MNIISNHVESCFAPKIIVSWSEKKANMIKVIDEHKHALYIQFNVFPSRSDINPIMGPPTTPPISNKVDNIPDVKEAYPRASFKYRGSQR